MINLINLIKGQFTDAPKGLTLPEYKELSNHTGEIQTLPIFEKYYISLLQRDGEKAIPCVNVGDKVKAGDIIARPTSHMALHRHAPTSGEITGIVEIRETHASEMTAYALEITSDGKDEQTDEFTPITDYQNTVREDLLKRIFRAGIAGMGGAGFPTEKKINLSNPVETLIINGAECEPYITCDDILMRHNAEEILRGAMIFAHILRCKQILVGIEDNKPEAISIMQEMAGTLNKQNKDNHCPITVKSMPTKYPMGSRHQIAHYLLGKKPDIRKRSYQSGFVCHNVATAKAAYDAVVLGKPLTERLVTFSGDGVEKAGVYLTKCGSDFADIAQAIGVAKQCDEIIFGGTMMGFAINPNNPLPIVIKRETTSVLAFANRPLHTIKQPSNEENCIRCGECADVCPMDLLPQQLQFYGRSDNHDKAQENRLFDCIECGLCTYVCPSNIPLVQIFQHSKGELVAERKKKQAAEHARIRFENRNARIEAEKAERARKSAERRARLKAQAEEKEKAKAKEKAAQATDNANKTTTDKPSDKSDLIAAALARTQAKKAAQNATSDTEKTIKDDKADLIAAALARTQAKKQKLAEQNNKEQNKKQETNQHTDKVSTDNKPSVSENIDKATAPTDTDKASE